MDSFDDIVAGIDLNVDTQEVERELAFLEIGQAIFAQLDEQGEADDPELVYLVTAAIFAAHMYNAQTLDDLFGTDAIQRIYGALRGRNDG